MSQKHGAALILTNNHGWLAGSQAAGMHFSRTVRTTDVFYVLKIKGQRGYGWPSNLRK